MIKSLVLDAVGVMIVCASVAIISLVLGAPNVWPGVLVAGSLYLIIRSPLRRYPEVESVKGNVALEEQTTYWQTHAKSMSDLFPEAEVVHLTLSECLAMQHYMRFEEWFPYGSWEYHISRADIAGRAWRRPRSSSEESLNNKDIRT